MMSDPDHIKQPSRRASRASPETARNRLLNARDAVEYLGISLSTLNRIEKQGLLVPFRTPGGHRRYGQQMLDEYLEGTRQRPDGQSRPEGSNHGS